MNASTTRRTLAAVALVATAGTLAACGGEPDPIDTATDAQVAFYDAYTGSVAPEVYGGTYAQALALGEAACDDLAAGLTVANLTDPAEPEASLAVVQAAARHLCPAGGER
jgi:hypothetical protein